MLLLTKFFPCQGKNIREEDLLGGAFVLYRPFLKGDRKTHALLGDQAMDIQFHKPCIFDECTFSCEWWGGNQIFRNDGDIGKKKKKYLLKLNNLI